MRTITNILIYVSLTLLFGITPISVIAQSGSIEELRRTVVILKAGSESDWNDTSQSWTGEVVTATGTIITRDGYILTARHVIQWEKANEGPVAYERVNATIRGGVPVKAKIIGRHSSLDLALLKIAASDLSRVHLGDSNGLEIAVTELIAIGHPYNSQLGRYETFDVVEGTYRGSQASLNELKFGGPIYSGNSGGPVFYKTSRDVVGLIRSEGRPGLEGYFIPIERTFDFLRSNGLAISDDGLVTAEEQTEYTNQLIELLAITDIIKSDLIWKAQIVRAVYPDTQSEVRRLRIWYMKKFEEQYNPEKILVKVYPVIDPEEFKLEDMEIQGRYIHATRNFGKRISVSINDIDQTLQDEFDKMNLGYTIDQVSALEIVLEPQSLEKELDFPDAIVSIPFGSISTRASGRR